MNSKEFVKNVLSQVADEVEQNPTRWTKEHLAKDKDGNPISAISPEACSWCAEGFILRELWRKDYQNYEIDQIVNKVLTGSNKFSAMWMHNDCFTTSSQFVEWFREGASKL